jgi:uncharacterized protein Veg
MQKISIYPSILAVQNNPESFPVSEINSNHYRFVLTKQTTIYYKFNNTEIRIFSSF